MHPLFICRYSFFKLSFNYLSQFHWARCWWSELYHITFSIYDEFCEIPRNHLCLSSLSIIQLTISSQISKNWIWICTVYFGFGEYWEIGIKILLDKLFDFRFGTTLLIEELVAWECQNFKTATFQIIMQFHHLLIIGGS